MGCECNYRFTVGDSNHPRCAAILNPGEESMIVECGYPHLNGKVCPIARYSRGEINIEDANRTLSIIHGLTSQFRRAVEVIRK